MGRFITADTVVPDWSDPQSLNRYSYCRNNPLKYVDPSGHLWGMTLVGFLKAVAWGAAIGAVVGGFMAQMNGGDVGEGIINGAISGTISGALFYAAGSVIENSLSGLYDVSKVGYNAAAAGVHTAAGATSGAVNAAITGGDVAQEAFISGMSAGAARYYGGANGLKLPGRMAIGAATGGVSSVLNGGDFAQGAIRGAMSSAIGVACNDGRHGFESFMNDVNREYHEVKTQLEKGADLITSKNWGQIAFGIGSGLKGVFTSGVAITAIGGTFAGTGGNLLLTGIVTVEMLPVFYASALEFQHAMHEIHEGWTDHHSDSVNHGGDYLK